MEKIKLADALANLRRELYKANEAAKDEGLKLEIDSIDVEFAVEIVKSGEASGKLGGKLDLDFVVVEGELKGGGDIGSTRSHRLKLHLRPTINGGRLPVSGEGHREDS